jgi:nucleotidyltransferase substrate binding protein (TIGR01987 family)
MLLDISALIKANIALENGLLEHKKTPVEIVRDGVIQRFEFTYEVSTKLLKKYLEYSSASSDNINEMSFPNLIRLASQKGLLLSDWSMWQSFRDARNITSHTYDNNKAQSIFELIPSFLKESKFLENALKQRLSVEN